MTLNDGETGRQRANVEKFLAFARDIGGASLSAFLRRLHDLQTREAREGEALGREPESGAVQLMSIHAAKGLEFPVVVVADLGRKKQSGSRSPYLLHDPEFGLVCKQRDQNGDWQKAAGYAWGEWLYGSMEEAENKRLLYVACTRAADKLILSGQVGTRNSWMMEILEAWNIEGQGEQTQRVPYDGYKIQVHRPVDQPDVVSSAPAATKHHPGQAEIDALAQPYPSIPEAPSIAVTKLDQLLQDGDQPRELLPALWAEEKQTSLNRAPGYMIGNIVHRALADWDCLSASEQELFQQLEKYAGREGVFPSAMTHAVKTARWMLGHVQNHLIFKQINAAKARHHEISFTLSSPVGMLHGVIDLLYQDESDNWHLIDWKTEWAPEDIVEESSEEHFTQMAVYAQAVKSELGFIPEVALCYLNPKMALFPFSHEFLVNTWKEKVLQTGN